MSLRRICLVATVLLFFAGTVLSADPAYDPLDILIADQFNVHDLTVTDRDRQRDIPVLVYLPSGNRSTPVVLFSHGLGGSRNGSAYLGKHWAARGYVAVFVQHPGSDTSVWKDIPKHERMTAMKKAAGTENFLLRVHDIPAVLDQLQRWNATDGHVLKGRLNLNQIGMSGHSFGAVTTQAVSGQRGSRSFTDSRIKASVAFSPSSPRRGDPESAFADVKIPWMLMTGTKDTAPIGDTDMESRFAVYHALPPGGKYELVLYGAEHSAFTERSSVGGTEKRNPNHHRAILALSTAFWDAWLREDDDAKSWLHGEGPRTVLEKDDRWQWK